MLAFCYDYDRYASERGMYFDIRDWLPSADNEDKLLELIKADTQNEHKAMTRKFQQKYVTSYGSAARESLSVIHAELSTK